MNLSRCINKAQKAVDLCALSFYLRSLITDSMIAISSGVSPYFWYNSWIVIPQYLWEDFANAIIVQAANDYRKVREKLYDNPEDRMAIAEKKSIEHFFHSNWYEVLTTVDGQYILNRLNNEPPGYYPNKTKPKEERKRNR